MGLGSYVLYNGYPSQAYLFILHSNGSEMLVTVFPVMPNPATNAPTGSNASSDVTSFLEMMIAVCPTSGESTSGSFNLPQLIPQSVFYSFQYDGAQYIVYGIKDMIMVPSNVFRSWTDIIEPTSWSLLIPDASMNIFMNPDGAKLAKASHDSLLYIDCSPTDTSETTIEQPVDSSSNQTTSWTIGPQYIFIFCVILFLYVLNVGIKKYFQPPTTKETNEKETKEK